MSSLIQQNRSNYYCKVRSAERTNPSLQVHKCHEESLPDARHRQDAVGVPEGEAHLHLQGLQREQDVQTVPQEMG